MLGKIANGHHPRPGPPPVTGRCGIPTLLPRLDRRLQQQTVSPIFQKPWPQNSLGRKIFIASGPHQRQPRHRQDQSERILAT